MILLGFLVAALVQLVDIATVPCLAAGIAWHRGPPLLAVTGLCAALRLLLAVIVRGSEQAARAPELFVLGIGSAAVAGAVAVLIGAALRHLLDRRKR